MGFTEAVKVCLTEKYADFSGRASRSEYWWFVLASVLFYILLGILLGVLGVEVDSPFYNVVDWGSRLALFLPSLGVQVRRLHDIGKGGQWMLIAFIPLLNLILFYW